MRAGIEPPLVGRDRERAIIRALVVDDLHWADAGVGVPYPRGLAREDVSTLAARHLDRWG